MPDNQESKWEKNAKEFSESGQEREQASAPGEDSGEEREEQFSFLQETIKPTPVTRKTIFIQLARVGLYGLIFGAFACLSFFALKPWAQEKFQAGPETVTIPDDEVAETESTENTEETEEKTEVKAPQTLDVDSLRELMKSTYGIAKEAKKSVAFVMPVRPEADASLEDSFHYSTTGLIVADNGQELLILCDSSVCAEAESFSITLADNSKYTAALKMKDQNRGFVVLAIPRSQISGNTWNAVSVAVLGNSNLVTQGDVVIALGNMFGYTNGIGYGIVSSNKGEETVADAALSVLATDIPMEAGGTGILFNLNGEVVGIIDADIWNGTQNNTVKAFAISDLKAALELLVNGQNVPYIGVFGTTISEAISKEKEMPTGIYVTQVETDSPAMAAGIQSGDILQVIAGEDIISAVSYEKSVLDSQVGADVKIKGKRRGSNGYVDVEFTVTVGSME